MAQTTTNYGLLKPESTDAYNHLIYDNPNMDTIDAAMKANSDAAITSATCVKSGNTHTIIRANSDASVMKFTATGDWNSGDIMVIDGVTVSPFLPNGTALVDGSYIINSEVLVSLVGTRATVYTNSNVASNIEYTAGVNVADAIAAASTAVGTEYSAGINVKQMLDEKMNCKVVAIGGYSTENLAPIHAINFGMIGISRGVAGLYMVANNGVVPAVTAAGVIVTFNSNTSIDVTNNTGNTIIACLMYA